mmetsp:Transcript_1222/g.4771  ORF Transcript_1222/g.4771 Transcript_1222/m.4771 type:complete len:217 (+) Transcript_1222:1455-2105(+)
MPLWDWKAGTSSSRARLRSASRAERTVALPTTSLKVTPRPLASPEESPLAVSTPAPESAELGLSPPAPDAAALAAAPERAAADTAPTHRAPLAALSWALAASWSSSSVKPSSLLLPVSEPLPPSLMLAITAATDTSGFWLWLAVRAEPTAVATTTPSLNELALAARSALTLAALPPTATAVGVLVASLLLLSRRTSRWALWALRTVAAGSIAIRCS